MQTLRNSQFQIEPEDDVPFETRHAIIERQIAAELAQLRVVRDQVDMFMKMEMEYKGEVQKLIGSSKYKDLRRYVMKENQALADLLLPPKGPEMSLEDRINLRLKRKKESIKFLDGLNVDLNSLRELNHSWRGKVEDLVPPIPESAGKPEYIVLPKDVPSEILNKKANPWTVKTPPYSGWAWRYDGWVGGFTFHPTLYLDHSAGLVGHKNYLKDTSASDWDAGHVTYDTQVGFWYKVPKTGMLEVWIRAKCSFNEHHCCLYDEFGWSDSFSQQYNYLTMKIASPNSDELRVGLMSWWYETGYTSGCWTESYLVDGNTYWMHFFSTAPYPKDTMVVVWVGMRTFHKCFSNDVRVYSYPKFKWFIEEVWMRPAP